MRKYGSALEHLAWRLSAGATSAWVSSFWRPVLICRGRPQALCLQGCPVAAGNLKGAFERGEILQSHLSLQCSPGCRWFPAQQLVLLYLLPWVFTPLVQHAGNVFLLLLAFWISLKGPDAGALGHSASDLRLALNYPALSSTSVTEPKWCYWAKISHVQKPGVLQAWNKSKLLSRHRIFI